jgi:NADPH:quinone reductase-like Zn-dependent oxidoreductase
MTVTQAMYLVGGFKAGKTILWHAGASSISIAGVQLSVASGAKATYITTSSQEKIDFCEQILGATKGFNYKEEDFSKAVLDATGGQGVDIIIDFVGASHFQQNLDSLAKDGTMVALASMSGVVVPNINLCPQAGERQRKQSTESRRGVPGEALQNLRQGDLASPRSGRAQGHDRSGIPMDGDRPSTQTDGKQSDQGQDNL